MDSTSPHIGLVGHSMGGRVAAHLAAQSGIEAVVALAPWWPDDDAALIPVGRRLLVAFHHRRLPHRCLDTRDQPYRR